MTRGDDNVGTRNKVKHMDLSDVNLTPHGCRRLAPDEDPELDALLMLVNSDGSDVTSRWLVPDRSKMFDAENAIRRIEHKERGGVDRVMWVTGERDLIMRGKREPYDRIDLDAQDED